MEKVYDLLSGSGKTQCFATVFLFAHLDLLPFDSFSSLFFVLLSVSSLPLPISAFLCVCAVTSKLRLVSNVDQYLKSQARNDKC